MTADGRFAAAPGVGLAFNPALADFIAANRVSLDYVEISPERFWHDSGPAFGRARDRYREIPEAVEQLVVSAADLPLVAHGVGLSIATYGPLDLGHAEQLARWHDRLGFAWVSEHLAYFRLGAADDWRGMGLMLPPVYDSATLADLAPKLRRLCGMFDVEVLIENAVDYAPADEAEFTEAAFLGALTHVTDARLLLDLHNIYTNARNQDQGLFSLVDALDLMLVREIHIAGGELLDGIWTDAHSGRCPDGVWTLLERVLSRPNGVRAITLEIGESYAFGMDPAVILDELARAREISHRAKAGADRRVAI